MMKVAHQTHVAYVDQATFDVTNVCDTLACHRCLQVNAIGIHKAVTILQ